MVITEVKTTVEIPSLLPLLLNHSRQLLQFHGSSCDGFVLLQPVYTLTDDVHSHPEGYRMDGIQLHLVLEAFSAAGERSLPRFIDWATV